MRNLEKRAPVNVDRQNTTTEIIHAALMSAAGVGKLGPVAYHLVAASLQLRFSDAHIDAPWSEVDSYGLGEGEFLVGNDAIHIAITPTLQSFDPCEANLEDGRHPVLLVPDFNEPAVREIAELMFGARVEVKSIEAFVTLSVDMLPGCPDRERMANLSRLFALFNGRVAELETDRSLLLSDVVSQA